MQGMLDCRATRFFDTCWHGVAHSSIVIKLLAPHKRRFARRIAERRAVLSLEGPYAFPFRFSGTERYY